METKTISITLKKAKEWYIKGGELKELALSAFTVKELEKAIESEWNYNDLLNKFAEKYPIGSVVRSNDISNIYPNVIISKPFLIPMPNSSYGVKHGVCFRTMCISPLDEEVFSSKILACRERDFINLTFHAYANCSEFVYKDWKRSIITTCNEDIETNRNDINSYKEKIDILTSETEQYEHVIEHFDEIYKKLYEKAMMSSEI